MDRPDIPWQEIAALLARRRRAFLAAFACGVVTVAAVAWLRDPEYEAATKLMVTAERARIKISPDAKAGPTVDKITEQDLNSEVALLTSVSLVREVLASHPAWIDRARDTGLGHRLLAAARLPLRLPGLLYRMLHRIPPLTRLEKEVQRSTARLAVAPLKKSSLIKVTYRHEDAAWAAEFLRTLVSHHVERRAHHNQQADAQRFFEDQRQLLSGKLRAAETALRDFYAREGIESTPQQSADLRARLSELETALSKGETALAEATARADFLAGEVLSQRKKTAPAREAPLNPSLQLIENRIVALRLQRGELLSKYAPTSIKIAEIDGQIAAAQQLLRSQRRKTESTTALNPTRQTLEMDLAQTQAKMAALAARVKSLRARRDRYRATLAHAEQIASGQQHLSREVETAKAALLTYLKKEEEARFANALDESRILNVSVVEPTDVPTAPLPSNAPLLFALGAIASLVAAILLAVFLDWLDPTVKSSREAQRFTELPVLAEIPS